jgi:pyridine nucleotide-disulfide oxidoreductase family protein
MTAQRRLVLVGGGHSHALVLASFAAAPEPRLCVTVISPHRYSTYSGMVPGVIAGRYTLGEAQIDVAGLAQRAAAAFRSARCDRLDAARRTVELSDGSRVPYDLLSFDIGSQQASSAQVEGGAPVVAVKPIEPALLQIDARLALAPPPEGRRIVVVGAGAAGTELAFALAARLRREPNVSIVLCDAAAHPVATHGARAIALVRRACAEAGIRFVGGAPVERVTRGGLQFTGGRELPTELVIWATGATAPRLFAESGLPVDRRGYLLVGADLRCRAPREIFAAGDCATLIPCPELPKAGVYAVRQGSVLAGNLRAAAGGGPLRDFRPRARVLALLNTGDGRAILSYGRCAWWSRWAWRLKDRIDRRFVARLAALAGPGRG